METAVHEIEETVNRLIEICREGQQGFQEAARAAKTEELNKELELYSRQRGDFAEALTDALARHGHKPTQYGSVQGVWRRGWTTLNTEVGENVDVVLRTCAQGEEAARQAYFDAMSLELPDGLKTLVAAQYRAVQTVHERIGSLVAAATGRTQGNSKAN